MTLTICYLAMVVVATMVGLVVVLILIFLSHLFKWHTVEDCICWAADKVDRLFYWILEKLLGKPEIKT